MDSERAFPFECHCCLLRSAIVACPMVIILNVVGSIWGTEAVQGELSTEFASALGQDAAKSIEGIIAQSSGNEKSLFATLIGIGTLIYGSTGVFYQLKVSLNKIWQIKADLSAPVKKIVIDRAKSLGFILVIGFLLLISFVLTAAVAAFSTFVSSNLPEVLYYVTFLLDSGISIGIISLLFALMFKYLPDADIKWKTVWIGSLVTALLFVLGKLALSLYFAKMEPQSTYGAAGTIILILLWVSYSCLILFFGAEFTYVYADRYGIGIRPSEIGKKTTDDAYS